MYNTIHISKHNFFDFCHNLMNFRRRKARWSIYRALSELVSSPKRKNVDSRYPANGQGFITYADPPWFISSLRHTAPRAEAEDLVGARFYLVSLAASLFVF